MHEGDWHYLCDLADFAGKNKLVRSAGGLSILLYRSGREVFAVRNRCTHLGMALDDGRIVGGQIICPFHGACFNLRSGAAVSGPAVSPLAVYAVRIDEGGVYVALPAGNE